MFPDGGGELICDGACQAIESIITADYGLYWKCFCHIFWSKNSPKELIVCHLAANYQFAAMTISPYRGFSLSIVLTELSTKSYDVMARQDHQHACKCVHQRNLAEPESY